MCKHNIGQNEIVNYLKVWEIGNKQENMNDKIENQKIFRTRLTLL